MKDFLGVGARWLEKKREEFLTIPVLYRRGTQEVQVTATVGRTIFKLQTGIGAVEHVEARDYLISAALLTTFGTPKPGDRIIEERDGQRFTAEVMAPGGEPAWRWSDSGRLTFRIHTKHLTTEVL
jgi:hypothetical protein